MGEDGRRAESDDVVATYDEADGERTLTFERESGETATIAQNLDGYAMLAVRNGDRTGPELERYYGFEMALDHVGEILGVPPSSLPIPPAGADMGM